MKMKNKKADQIAAKKKHLDNLKSARRKAKNLERSAPSLEEKPTILIVCEGKNTETSYFRQFRLSSAKIVAIGEGYNTVSLVKRAMMLSKEAEYDEVWVVFDKDDFKAQDFNNAIVMANGLNFRIGYSNQAFEYWLLLHLSDHQGGGMHRDDYCTSINKCLKEFDIEYDGNGSKIVDEDFFDILTGTDDKTGIPRMVLAITRAERNYKLFTHESPASEESSTTVFVLAKEILKYI